MPVYPLPMRSKLPGVGTSIFTVMSALSREENAINLSQGFPDFEVDPVLTGLVYQAMAGGFNQYAPMPGLLELREAIAAKMHYLYSAAYHPETEITITAGATQALYAAIGAVIHEGDEAIIFTPAYDSYAPAVVLNGGRPLFVPLKAPTYKIDWKEVKKLINRRTRLIILNSPHNPTGAILSAQDMMELERITSGNDIIIVSDEVYEHIIFDGYEHQSVARYPKLAERSFVIYSFGKTFHATGWKMGYCLAPANLMEEFRKLHQYQVFAVNHPIQRALATYISNPENYRYVGELYRQKRDLFNSLLVDSRFVIRPSMGTYFQLLDYSNISDEEDYELAVRWTKEHKVSSIPVSVFYHKPRHDKVLRFCFAKQNETLERAAEILCSL
jgi:methionine aminotransferase